MENSDTNISSPSSLSASSQMTSSAASWFSSIVRSRSATAMLPNNSAAGDFGGFSGPINNKHQFHCVMFKYGPKPIQVAFKTGDHKQQVVFIGGLKEGILATEYLEPLAIALEKEHWSLVQFLFSSSYSGYGISSLKQDAMELDQLISYLINKEDSHGVILLGHSTGCQDIIYYLRSNAACSRAVRAAILQAPVSDREYKATLPKTASMIDLASKMISEGEGSKLMPREANPDSPITAYRYQSLCGYNGDDDMFSSDFSEDELKQRLGHMSNTPTLVDGRRKYYQIGPISETFAKPGLNGEVAQWALSATRPVFEYISKEYSARQLPSNHEKVIFSMDDEYVPKHIDKKALVNRLCKAMGGAEKVEIEHGNHSLSNRVEEAVQAIVEIVKRDGPKGWEDPWS